MFLRVIVLASFHKFRFYEKHIPKPKNIQTLTLENCISDPRKLSFGSQGSGNYRLGTTVLQAIAGGDVTVKQLKTLRLYNEIGMNAKVKYMQTAIVRKDIPGCSCAAFA